MRGFRIMTVGLVVGVAGCDGAVGPDGEGAGPCAPSCEATSGVESACVALVDNTDKSTFGLRIAQLAFSKPAALANPLLGAMITDGVTMSLEECNLDGAGTISWLLQFDTAAGTLTTGTAGAVDSPTAGYCFADGPITMDTSLVDGLISASGDTGLGLEMSLGGTPVYLPVGGFGFKDLALSTNQSCIGSYNADTLDPANNCQPTADISAYTPGGAMTGYITLEDADAVVISSLNQSLCVLLTGEGNGESPARCARDSGGIIQAQGDWCAGTNSAAGCADAMALVADFAASAVRIDGVCG